VPSVRQNLLADLLKQQTPSASSPAIGRGTDKALSYEPKRFRILKQVIAKQVKLDPTLQESHLIGDTSSGRRRKPVAR
jgi:hypothetical protein